MTIAGMFVQAGSAVAADQILIAGQDDRSDHFRWHGRYALEQGRADLLARNHGDNGTWTLEVVRAPKTEGEN